jgi:hypothetical protein
LEGLGFGPAFAFTGRLQGVEDIERNLWVGLDLFDFAGLVRLASILELPQLCNQIINPILQYPHVRQAHFILAARHFNLIQ